MKTTNYDKRFLKEFTLAIIRTIEKNKFNIKRPKIIIDADLIPELSEALNREYRLNEELMERLQELEHMDFLDTTQSTAPKKTQTVEQFNVPHEHRMPAQEGNGYELILPFLKDQYISRIQCIGPNKPILIMKAGQRITTKVALSQLQIRDVFEHIADDAHIPLIEGPMKIRLDYLELDGIHAKITDSRFIIQKKTAYAMLEEKRNAQQQSQMPQRRVLPRRR